MMAAAQPFLSGAISKTVNMPPETTPEDIADAYRGGWKLGPEGPGHLPRRFEGEPAALDHRPKRTRRHARRCRAPRRERLPDTRQSITHKFNVAGHEGYITVGLYDDGRPGEVFLTMAKEGSTVGGLMDAFGTAISMSLQYGVPLEVYVNKFSHTRFEPMGYTKNPDIRIAKSIVDYIFRWLGMTFLPEYRHAQKRAAQNKTTNVQGAADDADSMDDSAQTGEWNDTDPTGGDPSSRLVNGSAAGHANGRHKEHAGPQAFDEATGRQENEMLSANEQFASFQADAPTCDNCGAITVRSGNCYLCHNCGNSMGCS